MASLAGPLAEAQHRERTQWPDLRGFDWDRFGGRDDVRAAMWFAEFADVHRKRCSFGAGATLWRSASDLVRLLRFVASGVGQSRTTGQVRVRVIPSIAWIFETTSLPSASMLAASTRTTTS